MLKKEMDFVCVQRAQLCGTVSYIVCIIICVIVICESYLIVIMYVINVYYYICFYNLLTIFEHMHTQPSP